MKKLNLY